MQSGNTIELDAMEFDPPASKRAPGGAVRPGASAGARGTGAVRPADDEVLPPVPHPSIAQPDTEAALDAALAARG